MKNLEWKYESDGDKHNKTHYIVAENPKGRTLKETFLRIDVSSKKEALKLLLKLKKE